MTDDYVEGPVWWNGSQALFRLALATASRARRMAEQQQRTDVDRTERRNREIDAGMTVVILVQAAMESYANFVYRVHAQTAPEGGWIARWRGFTAVAQARGVTDDSTLPPEHAETLAEVNAWRNYLVHGDERARDRLSQHLRAAGEDIGNDDPNPHHHLHVVYIFGLLRRVEAACQWAGRMTGESAPSSVGAWIAWDEY